MAVGSFFTCSIVKPASGGPELTAKLGTTRCGFLLLSVVLQIPTIAANVSELSAIPFSLFRVFLQWSTQWSCCLMNYSRSLVESAKRTDSWWIWRYPLVTKKGVTLVWYLQRRFSVPVVRFQTKILGRNERDAINNLLDFLSYHIGVFSFLVFSLILGNGE